MSEEPGRFPVPGGSFPVQLNNHSVASGSAECARHRTLCANRIKVSGLRAGWIQLSLHAQAEAGLSVDGQVEGRIWTVADHRPRNAEIVEKDFVVLPAITSYTEAHQVARTAARRLGLKLDLGAPVRMVTDASRFGGRLQGQQHGVSLLRVARPGG